MPTLRQRRRPAARRPLVDARPRGLAGLHDGRPHPHRPAQERRTAVTSQDPDRIPLSHSVRYAARGLPEVPHRYHGRGVLVPSEITLTYSAAPESQHGTVHAFLPLQHADRRRTVVLARVVVRARVLHLGGTADRLRDDRSVERRALDRRYA